MKLALITIFALVITLTACSSAPPLPEKNETDTQASRQRLQELLQLQKANKGSNFSEQTGPSINIKPLPTTQQAVLEKKWLTDIAHITLDPAKDAVIPATAIIRMLRSKGINIVTSVPLDLYTYNGFGVTDVNAETALMVFLGEMHLDYALDNARRLVIIEPMKDKTWTLNIGNRRTSFNAGEDASSTSAGSGANGAGNSGQGAGSQSQGMGGGAPMPGMASQYGGQASPGNGSGATPSGGIGSTGNSNSITASDDVWTKLEAELRARVTILIPKPTAARTGATPIVPAITSSNPRAGNNPLTQSSLYDSQVVGHVSLNPDTGAINVRAPKYLLKSIDEYITKTQEMYNTVITFEGEILTLTTSRNVSEGIDWTAFNNAAGGTYTSIAQNNILGGAVLTPAAGTNAIADALTVTNASIPGANALFGIASITKKFAAFNAYLSSVGQLRIKDTPLITTTHGTPVKFKNTTTRHYQRFQQVAAAGGVGSATTATNTINVPYETGMTLRLNPRYDAYTGLVRTQFSLKRKMIEGYDPTVNPITVGNTIQIINSTIPIIGDKDQDGELLLKNGEVIVVGGLSEDTEDNTTSGVTGLIETPFKALAGKDSRNQTRTTYYFALRVTVSKKE